MSATSSPDVERLQKLVLHNPVALNLTGQGQGQGQGGAEGDAAARDGAALASGSGVSADIQHFYIQVGRGEGAPQGRGLVRRGCGLWTALGET